MVISFTQSRGNEKGGEGLVVISILQQCSSCGFILLIFNHTENVARVFRVVKGGVHYMPESSITASYKVYTRVPYFQCIRVCVCVCVSVTELWSVVCFICMFVCVF